MELVAVFTVRHPLTGNPLDLILLQEYRFVLPDGHRHPYVMAYEYVYLHNTFHILPTTARITKALLVADVEMGTTRVRGLLLCRDCGGSMFPPTQRLRICWVHALL